MRQVSFGYTKNLGKVGFDEGLRRVTDALQREGFGILTEIDVQATLKKKLDVNFRKYRILGACNPPLAYRALSGDPLVGLLLPCNAIVFEEDDGTISVSIQNPRRLFELVDRADLAPIAAEVDERIGRAFQSI